MLSAYNGDLIGAEASWTHFTSVLKRSSVGVYGVTVAECAALNLPARPDPDEFPEHAVIDFTGVGSKDAERKSKVLRKHAEDRGWLYQPAGLGMSNPQQLVQKLWNYCSILRDDGLSYGDLAHRASTI
jgi:hypothetical protein